MIFSDFKITRKDQNMSTINEYTPNIRCIEYKQDSSDKDYGSCLYARFYLNLDRFELSIISDCGSYGYKWVETKETFPHLLARMDAGYLIGKIYGHANIFDFEKTKQAFYDLAGDDPKYAKYFDDEFTSEPEDERDFIDLVHSEWPDEFDDCELWNCMEYMYPGDILKIGEVFEQHIKPYIQQHMVEESLDIFGL